MVEEKKGREKSPMYPSIDLKNAIAKAKALYDAAGRNCVDKRLAAEAMGYKSNSPKSLSGSALTLLSSLYQYGLVARKKGEIGISDDAFTILHAPEGSTDRTDALAKCGSKPKIFNEIYAKYSGKLPADNILIWYLQQQKYSRQAAETIIQCYKETVEYANLSEKWPITDTEETVDVPGDTDMLPDAGQMGPPPPQRTGSLRAEPWHFPLLTKKAIVSIVGDEPPTQEDVDLLIKLLEGFKLGLHSKKQQDNTDKQE